MKIGNYLDKLNEFEFLDIPFGAGAYFTIASSLSDTVIQLLNHFLPVPPIVTGSAAAWLFRKKFVSDFLGEYGSLYASIASTETAINDQFHLKDRIDELLGKVDNEVTSHVEQIPSSNTTSNVPVTTASTVSGFDDNSDISNIDNLPEISNDLVNAYLNQQKIV